MNKGHLTNKAKKDKKELHWTKDSIIGYVYNVSDEDRTNYLSNRQIRVSVADDTNLTELIVLLMITNLKK